MADETTNAAPAAMDDFDIPLDAPESGPPTAHAQAQAPTGGPDTPAETQQPQSALAGLPPDLAEAVQEEQRHGFKLVPGESVEDTTRRLIVHQSRKNAAYRRDLARSKDSQAAAIQSLKAEMRQYFEPILRDYHQRSRQEAIEAAAAQIPPKGTPEYQEWLLEENLRRDDERRRMESEGFDAARQKEEEDRQAAEVAAIDEVGFGKVAEGLGLIEGRPADPEFTHAYHVYSQAAVDAARSYWPSASEEQVQEFVALSQRLDVRRAEANGADIRQVMKARMSGMIDNLVARGLVTRVAAAGAPVSVPAPASGSSAGSQARPAPTPTAAQRVTADAQAAARRGPAAVPATTRPSALPGQFPDAGELSEDDFVEAALAGMLGNEEQRVARHRKER